MSTNCYITHFLKNRQQGAPAPHRRASERLVNLALICSLPPNKACYHRDLDQLNLL